jgi:hypothetical protein
MIVTPIKPSARQYVSNRRYRLSSRIPHTRNTRAYIPPYENMTPEQKFRIIRLVGFAGLVILHATMECLKIYASRFNKTPLHTSRLTGVQWVQELTDGHKERFYNKMGMCESIFTQLLPTLHAPRPRQPGAAGALPKKWRYHFKVRSPISNT